MDTPKIYVACLAAYNGGILYGQWFDIDCGVDEDDVHDGIKTMLTLSPAKDAEEWAIHAFEGFGEYQLSENESINHVIKLAEFIAQHGDLGAALLGEHTIKEAETLLEDHYHGAYDNEVDFAYYIFDTCHSHTIPEDLVHYFDYVAFTRDLFISDYFSVQVDGQTHVFSYY